MPRLSEKQLAEAIQQLPRPLNYRGEYFRIPVREELYSLPYATGADVNRDTVRVIEFEKSEDGGEWLLASMPEY